ncbi:MAG: acyl-CoA thioesterase [Ilumatobacteraceae bacterium]
MSRATGGAFDETTEASWISQLVALRPGDVVDHFIADGAPSPQGRVFGGLIAAQALAAAAKTVAADKLPQSLHLYFVRPGVPDTEVAYDVERTRDGRSFDTRQVTARQGADVILEMITSFHRPEPDVDQHRPATLMIGLADSRAVSGLAELGERFELRVAAGRPGLIGPPYWVRSKLPVEDDPVIRACALAYLSDLGLMAAASPVDITSLRTPIFELGYRAASIDHAVWFHRAFHPDQWHWFEASSVNNNDSRGLAVGAFFDTEGSRIATVIQEALWRPPR